MQARQAHGTLALPFRTIVSKFNIHHRAHLHAPAATAANRRIGVKWLVAHGIASEPGPDDVRLHPPPTAHYHIGGAAVFGYAHRHILDALGSGTQFLLFYAANIRIISDTAKS